MQVSALLVLSDSNNFKKYSSIENAITRDFMERVVAELGWCVVVLLSGRRMPGAGARSG